MDFTFVQKKREVNTMSPHHLFRQRGISLPMISIALAVMTVISIGVARRSIVVAETAAGASAGYALNQVSQAVNNYRGANMSALTTASPSLTGFADPFAPTVAELKTAGYLNAAVATALPDGNSYRVSVSKMPAGCVGPAATCNVWSMLSLTNPIVDLSTGKPSITRLGALASAVDDTVSYSSAPDPTQITGGGGSWTVANPDAAGRAGIVVVVAGLGGTGTQWLRVADPRDPGFTGNLTVAGFVKPSAGPGQTVVAGTACTEPSGAIRNDATGRVLSCQNGIWTGGSGEKSVAMRAPVAGVPGGTSFAVDTCAAGGTPWATFSQSVSAINLAVNPPYQALTFSVNLVGSNWVTRTEAIKPPGGIVTVNGDISVLAIVPTGIFASGCSYG